MTSVLNQGCRLEVHAVLPVGEAMQCTAQLVELEREPRKIKVTTKITTATRSGGLACTAYVYAVIPQKASSSEPPREQKEAREPAAVPAGAVQVAEHALLAAAGRHYAYLSGDFNPIHWIHPLAKMSGFPTCILHGFAQMALVQEDLVRSRCHGDAGQLEVLDVRFVSPLVLGAGAAMAVHVDDASSAVLVTDGDKGAVTVVGTFELRGRMTPAPDGLVEHSRL
jgi:acyl dehydratase